MTAISPGAPPGSQFHFARYPIGCNLARPVNPAYIDNQGSLSYGHLAEHTRSQAAART